MPQSMLDPNTHIDNKDHNNNINNNISNNINNNNNKHHPNQTLTHSNHLNSNLNSNLNRNRNRTRLGIRSGSYWNAFSFAATFFALGGGTGTGPCTGAGVRSCSSNRSNNSRSNSNNLSLVSAFTIHHQFPRPMNMSSSSSSSPSSSYSTSSSPSSGINGSNNNPTSSSSASSLMMSKKQSFSNSKTISKDVDKDTNVDTNVDTNPEITTNTSSSSTSKHIKEALSRSSHPLSNFASNMDNSWVDQLNAETTENRLKSQSQTPHDDGVSNNIKRPVYNGHYVPVLPDALQNPRLVIHSPDMAHRLGFTEEEVHSVPFLKYFSGDVLGAFDDLLGDDLLDSHDDNHNLQTHVRENVIRTWATPYALSIVGKRYTNNCPFGTGDGYGDGRAISIGELTVHPSQKHSPQSRSKYEMQLKGAGPTPFCRGADGRAVLRSSIREFLASEAMHHLHVATTRALSLVVSPVDTSRRPWYSDRNIRELPDMDDPRLARYTPDQRKTILRQLAAQTRNDPDVLIEEPNAMTCRISASFVRVGHFDLFARRVMREEQQETTSTSSSTHTPAFGELEELMWHACYREFPDTCYHPFISQKDALSASKALLEHAMMGIATMTSDWIRVGFSQGNFNADNCLVAGRTMDYGPFGWMDEYHPLFAKWTGSGEHFGFMNQPNAGFANFAMLVSSIMPIIEGYSSSSSSSSSSDDDNNHTMEDAKAFREDIIERAQTVFAHKLFETFRLKMGFHPMDESPDDIWPDLEELLRDTRADWTLFWRQLSYVARDFPLRYHHDNNDNGKEEETSEQIYQDMLNLLIANDDTTAKPGSSPFYEPLTDENKTKLLKWIQQWRTLLHQAYHERSGGFSTTPLPHETKKEVDVDDAPPTPASRMLHANPKYILREWMLVDAYSKASSSSNRQQKQQPFGFLGGNDSSSSSSSSSEHGDESVIHELFDLIQNPYEEGTDEQDLKYYRRAPDHALKAGGTAFMS